MKRGIIKIFGVVFLLVVLLLFYIPVYATEIVVNTGNEEADAVFQEFYDDVKHIDGDSDWDGFFLVYQAYEDTHAGQYAEICNGTAEDWKGKTAFERFIWYETYVRIVQSMRVSSYDYFFGSESNFIKNTIDSAYHGLNTFGDDTEAEAYKTLMLWQYAYIKEHGVPYNFLTGLNYLESNRDAVPLDPEQETKEKASQEQAELAEIQQALLNDSGDAENNNAASSGIWGDMLQEVKSNAFALAFILLLCGGIIAIIIYRKKKAID